MAELFLNGESCGLRWRSIQEFPAAGLHWLIKFKAGENRLRAVGHKYGATVEDAIVFEYQTARWGKASRMLLAENARDKTLVTVEASLVDAAGTLCLDARNLVRFTIAGDGTLLDDLGTDTGSRMVGLYNGVARIGLQTRGGQSVVSCTSSGFPTAFLTVP